MRSLRRSQRTIIATTAVAGLGLAVALAPVAHAANPLTITQSVSPTMVPAAGANVTYTVTIRNSAPTTAYEITTLTGTPCSTWEVVSGNKDRIEANGSLVMTCSMFAKADVVNKFNIGYRPATGGTASTPRPTASVTSGATTNPTTRPTVNIGDPPTMTATAMPTTVVTTGPTMSSTASPSQAATGTPVSQPTSQPSSSRPNITTGPTQAPRPTTAPKPGGGNGSIGGDLFGGGFMGFFAKLFAWLKSLFGMFG